MSRERGRATWIWKTKDIISDSRQVDFFASFAQRNRLRRVYVHINPDLSPDDFAAFVSRCGIAVEALMGDPGWVQNPHHESVKSRLRWVADYQARHVGSPDLQMKGLHLDIEPWNLPGWKTSNEAHLQFINVLGIFKDFAANACQPPLPVTADLPFWLHNVLSEANFAAVLDVLDGATFMTYRNSPEAVMGIAGVAWQALRLQRPAAGADKTVDLAIETCPSGEGPQLSYHGCGRARLDADLACLEREKIPGGAGHRVGLAVHDYHRWVEME